LPNAFASIVSRLAAGANRDPTSARIPADHILKRVSGSLQPADDGETLEAGAAYFVVTLERARLVHGRRWWSDVTPMVYIMASFTYGGTTCEVPVVLGPALLQAPGQSAPAKTIFRALPVAGPHPYVGGALDLTVVLYEVPMTNDAQRILESVGVVSSSLPIAPALSAYLPIAGAVVSGLGLLLDIGKTRPVMGCRHGTGDEDVLAAPGTFVVLADPKRRPEKLWLIDDELREGDTAETAKVVDDVDYVLYRVRPVAKRDDARDLPFVRSLWERVVRQASDPADNSWTTAKTLLGTLFQELRLSPDVSRDQYAELYVELRDEAKALREQALELAHLGGPSDLDDDDRVLQNITMSVLGLD
jgi:hypothetical protein